MKNIIKTFSALLIIITPNIVSAGSVIDDTLKNQCKYILYGNMEGTNSDQADGYLLGFVQGVEYMTAEEDLTDFLKSRNKRMVIERACKNALKNSTQKGFESDYKLEASKLVSKSIHTQRTKK
ncbi:MAG: hypothetical protein WBM70_09520 [Sulfurovum sp.]|uniref:hypothetical protein n=1 Tax=Sulfurovum sp. TaxID=1969726 RepID=UPI003C73F4D9